MFPRNGQNPSGWLVPPAALCQETPRLMELSARLFELKQFAGA